MPVAQAEPEAERDSEGLVVDVTVSVPVVHPVLDTEALVDCESEALML